MLTHLLLVTLHCKCRADVDFIITGYSTLSNTLYSVPYAIVDNTDANLHYNVGKADAKTLHGRMYSMLTHYITLQRNANTDTAATNVCLQ